MIAINPEIDLDVEFVDDRANATDRHQKMTPAAAVRDQTI